MKKITFFLISALLLLTTLGGYIYLQQNRELTKYTTSLAIEIKTIKEDSELYKIRAEYPLFENVPKDFNDKIESLVLDEIKTTKRSLDENWKIRKNAPGNTPVEYEKPPCIFNLTWTPQQLNTLYISFVMKINAFEGGANERQDIVTFNYDLKNKKEVKLVDLFPGKKDYLTLVSNYVKGDLMTQFKLNNSLIPVEMLNSGASASEINFSRFTFDENSIVFYFPKATVAPGAYGEQKVVMFRN